MAKEKKVTKFAEESAANPDSPATTAPSAAMLALFKPAAEQGIDLSKLERRNLPPMVKPADVQIGGVVMGEMVAFPNSPVSTIKGKLIWIRPVKIVGGKVELNRPGEVPEYTFPCTGTIRSALAPGVEGDKELTAALDKEVGKILVARRVPDKANKKYNRDMFMFEVFTVDKGDKIA